MVLTAGHAGEMATALAAERIPARAGYLAEPLHCAPALTENPVYGSSRFPLQVPPASRIPAYGWGTLPNAERLVRETLVVVDWNEHYTDDHVRHVAAAVRRVTA